MVVRIPVERAENAEVFLSLCPQPFSDPFKKSMWTGSQGITQGAWCVYQWQNMSVPAKEDLFYLLILPLPVILCSDHSQNLTKIFTD